MVDGGLAVSFLNHPGGALRDTNRVAERPGESWVISWDSVRLLPGFHVHSAEVLSDDKAVPVAQWNIVQVLIRAGDNSGKSDHVSDIADRHFGDELLPPFFMRATVLQSFVARNDGKGDGSAI